ncbi:MAG: DUF4367 domain-containing protein [Candidatus Saccharibacteria bacterium]
MKNDKIVTINGQKYDSATGLPLSGSISQSNNKIVNNKKNSQTNGSSILKKVGDISSPIRKIGRNMDIARSKSITHFSKHPSVIEKKPNTTKKVMDVGPRKHHLVKNIEKAGLLKKSESSNLKSSKTIKEEVFTDTLNKMVAEQKTKRKLFNRNYKFINIFSICLVLLIIAGYFTYINMPSLSVRIASLASGINATYPEYKPDGYSTNGPVKYTEGQVTINFHANTGSSEFTIKQSKSSWDSSAVKNQISKDSNGEFITTEEHGLTIYSYNGNATWVNGGILYTIRGNAPLSSDQIRRIATSL